MRHAFALLFVLLAASACGEVVLQPDAGTDALEIDAVVDPCTQAEVSIDDFFTCLSQEICDVYTDCAGSNRDGIDCADLPFYVFGGLPPTPLKVVIRDAVDSGRAQWNPTAAQACLQVLRSTGCSLFKGGDDVFATCAAIVGNVNNGQLCQNDIECATPGAQCVDNSIMDGNLCTSQVCRAPTPAGQQCTGGAFCRPQDRCVSRSSGNGDMSVCATGEAGQICDGDEDCDGGLFCNGGLNNSTAAGICTISKPSGAVCRTDAECMGELLCVGNTQTSSGTCRDVRPAGAMCDRGNLTGCFGNQYCDATSSTAVGTCSAAPQANEACGPVNGVPRFCGFFMTCDNGVCRAPGVLAETCSDDGGFGSDDTGCNLGLYCAITTGSQPPVGVCAELLPNGSTCMSRGGGAGESAQCASGWCSDNATCSDFPTCDF